MAAQSADQWTIAQNSHFEVYSQTTDQTAQNALVWFEQLRTFFQQNGLLMGTFSDQDRPPLQVIGFRSGREYQEYRVRPFADAYYASDGSRDYIVMSTLGREEFHVAVHEYVHYVLNASGLTLPGCLNEGLAEFFSTLRVRKGGYEVGGDLPPRTQTLQRNKWLPLGELFEVSSGSSLPNTRRGTELFYAESWALVDMLMASPAYAVHFRELVSEFNAGSNGVQAFRKVYGKSLDEAARDLENWVRQPRSARLLLSQPTEFGTMQSLPLSTQQRNVLLAQLSIVSGRLEQAKTRYKELLREEPDNPDFAVALGALALRQGNRDEALKEWRQALNNKMKDAEICYRYALLAEEAGWNAQEVKAALERAVKLAPSFDDARYKLALVEKQTGEYRSAVEQLRAMRVPVGARRYAYWIAMSSALIELDERDEAKEAAREALRAAQNEADRMEARRMGYVASTDLTVQFATDSEGHSQMVTTRIAHGTTDWNPFIEPSDRIQHADGKLGDVLCTSGKLSGFLLRTSKGPITLDVPDPLHVLMRNSPNEFFCGPMQEKAVAADFAVVSVAGKTTNVLRGMTFQ